MLAVGVTVHFCVPCIKKSAGRYRFTAQTRVEHVSVSLTSCLTNFIFIIHRAHTQFL